MALRARSSGSRSPERRKTGTELGGALGIAILGSLGTAVYRSEVGDAVSDGVPSHAADAVRDTLGGAVGVADRVSVDVIAAATEAFAHGLQVVAVASALLMLAMAVLAALVLRETRIENEPDAELPPEPDAAAGGPAEVAPVLAGC